jgi:hypothetical protein
MNTLRFTLNFAVALTILFLIAPACEAIAATNVPPSAGAAVTNKIPAASGSATNNASTNASTELPVPLSVFDLAAKPTKDPFFPLSTRQPMPTATNSAPAFSIAEFTLKGLSGTAHNRLALVNNRTLGEGEDTELTTASGKIKIQCVEIKDSSVVIRVGPHREVMEIFLRKSAQ